MNTSVSPIKEDDRSVLELELDHDELYELMLLAHERDITLNQLVEQTLKHYMEEHKQMTTRNWSSGLDNYRNHTVEFLADKTIFTTELLEVPRQFNTISDAFNAHLDGVNLPVEVLYSGGLDSECVLLHCLRNSIPVVAVTMRLLVLGRPINVHDLYYAERFCREHSIKHRIIDLDVDKFFNNGDHIPLVEPYRFTRFTAGAMLWLIKQCESFPVIGGDWTWPQVNMGRPIYSPHRYDYSAMELFMADNGIQGIGNMLSHSLDSNAMFIK